MSHDLIKSPNFLLVFAFLVPSNLFCSFKISYPVKVDSDYFIIKSI